MPINSHIARAVEGVAHGVAKIGTHIILPNAPLAEQQRLFAGFVAGFHGGFEIGVRLAIARPDLARMALELLSIENGVGAYEAAGMTKEDIDGEANKVVEVLIAAAEADLGSHVQ
jgi:hypothetical protein